MGAALALGERGRGRTAPNPSVGCVLVKDDRIVGRGWTQPGGRPHGEAMAIADAGAEARGAVAYVTLEPCAHSSPRGPACADLLIQAGVARVVVAIGDPDPRTNGAGLARLAEAGIAVTSGPRAAEAERSLAGFLARIRLGRPYVTLKLAMSLDGKIALPSGESRWITGEDSRAHVHGERARADMILVGRGTYDSDRPKLDVRLPGLEPWSPRRALLTRGDGVPEWHRLGSPEEIHALKDVNDLFVEGGSGAASAFLKADLVDRMLLYRAPILIGEGKQSLGYIGLTSIAEAHRRWRLADSRMLGIDRLEVYERDRL
ncbi:bifunctional diaminohydroxyphosphoribosylaminopyrimidine deaminase/5-amino-6-(5-phosphoribosylamino)uracil reductase RibD [Sphingosinicella sp. BN140058]|uniref:bifunctional diaminohydroxyphosphoribosylaminopyrimidine deaminase/5-amino-6-(5-phosphoribosylamino)uracil reductase RibD n=1 Tax=Sphingosinicella sp. BN140058 TaxID=1892855 RepID=UPI00101377A0|nr:bifunctional diaminohydroxyphosphoribosylaminopyrimidine deaminase/5-amino-6-(5-phosphoribosylamino)uracil reductase RibD [Sphingosinicella sp. BN140058]QAY79844.1 bifunctional diaminohydroxyphosphoribosylaminopyrimidine deaminase/5-amino-6-(5-phosphoribosylamino)uracil reductase RibD [Sphingosinicella sp. BN140058]